MILAALLTAGCGSGMESAGPDAPQGGNPDAAESFSLAMTGQLAGLEPEDLAVVGGTVYVGDGTERLVVVDASDPASPARLGALLENPGENTASLQIVGSRAFLSEESDGMLIVDVSDPNAPSELGRYPAAYAKEASVNGDLAYVADQDHGLRVVDIGNPGAPTLAGSVALADGPFGIASSGTMVYVADDDAGLAIVDASNPGAPSVVGTETSLEAIRNIAVAGDLVYVLAENEGLVAVDVSNPNAPARAGTYATGLDSDLFILGNHAYLAGGGGVEVVDISNPAQMTMTTAVDAIGFATTVAATAEFVYVGAEGAVLVFAKE